MSTESVALTPECAECGAVWLPADGGALAGTPRLRRVPRRTGRDLLLLPGVRWARVLEI